jgi:hypothetical protein
MQLSAQNGGSNPNRTIVYDYAPPADYTVFIEVYCDGVWFDQVSVSGFTLEAKDHYNMAEVNTWGVYSMKDVVFTSTTLRDGSYETFVVHGFLEKDDWEQGFGEWHMNLIGDKGHQYILHATYTIENWTALNFEYQTNCH